VLRNLLAFFAFLFFTVVGSLAALPAGLIDPTGDLVLTLARWWSRAILGAAGVRLHVITHATLDPKRSYVVMPNHVSAVDVWAVFLAVPVPLRFIAKKQLGWIPLFGWAMRAGRFIFIDRQNASSARRSIDLAAKQIHGGRSVVIFPEGTRARAGRLGPFKKGAFHLAIGSGAEVVPVAIRGSYQVMRPGAWFIRPGRVEIEIGVPIPTTGMGPGDRDALMERVRAEVAAMLNEDGAPAPGDSAASAGVPAGSAGQ
jgi:1-acyl-sn-glycerol-3-phosphate acyltransferase